MVLHLEKVLNIINRFKRDGNIAVDNKCPNLFFNDTTVFKSWVSVKLK